MKIVTFKSAILLVLLFSLNSLQKTQAQVSPFNYGKFVSKNGDSLKYRLLISDADTISKYPLVIFLHGVGERGDDNETQLKWGVKNFASDAIMKTYRPIVLAPQCPVDSRWSNYVQDSTVLSRKITLKPQASRPMVLLMELVDQLIEKLPVDPNRIYITGLSMGGTGTFDAISRYPDKFAAAVPVCGTADPNYAEKISNIPIWIFQGALDPLYNPKTSQNLLEDLTSLGAHPGFTQYPETGHFAWLAAYSDSMMMAWMFRQRKISK